MGMGTIFDFLSPLADRHTCTRDISFRPTVSLFVRKIVFTDISDVGDEIWQDCRPGWVASHLIFW